MGSLEIIIALVVIGFLAHWLNGSKKKTDGNAQTGSSWGIVEYWGASMDGEARIGGDARIARIGDMPVEYSGAGMDGSTRMVYVGTR